MEVPILKLYSLWAVSDCDGYYMGPYKNAGGSFGSFVHSWGSADIHIGIVFRDKNSYRDFMAQLFG